MDSLTPSVIEAIRQLYSFDPLLWEIVLTSLSVSTRAVCYMAPAALLLGFVLAYYNFFGRKLIIALIHTLWAVPAVVIGLTLYLLLSRAGMLGDLNLLFTQDAMVIGQMLLCFPILVLIAHTTFQTSGRSAWESAITLGASTPRAFFTLLYEVRFGLMAALVAAYGRVIAEVGCSMIVGGNILHHTRNIPTAIALETSRGEFAQGIALGIVLLVLAMALNFSLTYLRVGGSTP